MLPIDILNGFSKISNINTTLTKHKKFIAKHHIKNKLTRDVFEKSKKIKEFFITHICAETKESLKIKVEQNPLDRGVLYKKILNDTTGKTEKIQQGVEIAKSQKDWQITYHFLEPGTKEEIGFVTINDWRLAKNKPIYAFLRDNSRLLDDFQELGIVGDRISIEFLQNNLENKYSKVGELADQIAIEYCLKEKITPNIVSVADLNSHAAHYKRGRRFFKLDKNDPDIDYYEFKAAYKTDDPNKIIEERINNTPQGLKTDTSDLCGLYMYMPQKVIQEYLQRIKENPILH